jgi:membrane associated rhomboid family serine protease
MNIRLILWTLAMAYVGVLVVGKGSYLPLNVTASGALMGGGLGLILAIMFSRRSRRKRASLSALRRY